MPELEFVKKACILQIENVSECINTGVITLTFVNKRYAELKVSRALIGESTPLNSLYYYVVTPNGACIISPQQYQVLTQ